MSYDSTPPPLSRWYCDRGAIPGEALAYLDVPHESLRYASAIIVEEDTGDPLTQACSKGPWLKCGHTIPASAIHAAYPVTVQMIRQLIERTRRSSSK